MDVFAATHRILGLVVVAFLLNTFFLPDCTSLHLYGTWNPDEEFFLFVTKFGFQKTDLTNKNDTQGFIFGNITVDPTFAKGGNDSIEKDSRILPAALVPKKRVPRFVEEVNGSSSNLSRKLSSNITNGTHDSDSFQVQLTRSTLKPVITKGNNSHPSSNILAALRSNASGDGKNIPAVFSETFVSHNTSKFPSAKVLPFTTPKSQVIKPPFSGNTSSNSTPEKLKLINTTLVTPILNSSERPSEVPSKSTSRTSTTTSKPSTHKTTVLPLSQFYPATLVVLDRGLFIHFYKSRLIDDKDEACRQMFQRISQVSYDPYCLPDGTENLLKRVPCPNDEICPDDRSNNQTVVKGNQFTYAISDLSKAKFWYVSLVPCYRDTKTCEWKYSKNITTISYDIWLVNGNPYTKNQNPLEYQFSFDRQDTVEIYLVFFLCYLVLVPLQIHAVLRQRHIVPKLFTASVALELAAITSNVIHVLKFALDGEGHFGLAAFGDFLDIIARAIFMLILLVLAKGWAVTRTELTGKPFIFSIWTIYGVVHLLLYVWKETEVDVIEDIDEYQTWPGWLILIIRTIIMIWFLYELKDTMDHEHQPHKLNFFLHFGAAALVWFIYLPIVALIALQVSPLWRSKFLLGITYSADCLGFAIMTHLLWPTRTEQYFLLMSKEAILTDELEEFNEAPHVVNSYVRRPNHWYPVNYSFQDVSSPEAVSLTQGSTLHNQYPHQRFTNGTNSFSEDVKDNVPLIIT